MTIGVPSEQAKCRARDFERHSQTNALVGSVKLVAADDLGYGNYNEQWVDQAKIL